MEPELLSNIADAKRAADVLPPSREKSIVLTKLDEARLWAQEALKAEVRSAPATA